ncbi:MULTISPECIES: hypothetical protein [Providencia]|uniref:hypothetical protein n=1 Tax=Providencia TaxID=586 RepID=UPI0008FB2F6A|nr:MULTISPECIES: hypothetical protein [Providencia]AVL72378.1 hypothetical protein CEQ08_00955 [Providencia rettgeri]EKH6496144.1 hypothetical protein [Providencia rettgeri]ELR5053145.1 hypothetical protein [Providencia rettgeri]ELR5155367.1 hypothetical protein [Providencia rettgeri]ELR5181522.1 hypothetical protein [Providencia rettgeri]
MAPTGFNIKPYLIDYKHLKIIQFRVMPPIMPPFYFVTQKLRGSSLIFPNATSVAKISSIDDFIADNEIPTRNNPIRNLHVFFTTAFSNGTITTEKYFSHAESYPKK